MNCIICGSQFEPNKYARNQKTCSAECRRKHYSAQNLIRYHERGDEIRALERERWARKRKDQTIIGKPASCQRCGTEFTIKHSSQKYCSKTCTVKAKISIMVARRKKDFGKATCQKCGNEFQKKRAHNIMCPTCSLAERTVRTNIGEILKCANCEKEFTVRRYKQRFCSNRCNDLLRWRAKQKANRETFKERPCIQCGKSFMPGRRNDEKLCSAECRQRRNNSRTAGKFVPPKKFDPIVNCSECGKKFKRNNYRILCCSQECSRNRKHKIEKKIPSISVSCKICGTVFLTSFRRANACSDKCRNRIATLRTKEKRRRLIAQFGVAVKKIQKAKSDTQAESYEVVAKPTWKVPETISCAACGKCVNRSEAITDCCSQHCLDAALNVLTVRTMDDHVEVGTIVLIKRYSLLTINDRQRLISSVDSCRVEDIIGGVAVIPADRVFRIPISDIEVAEGAIARVKRLVNREKTVSFRRTKNHVSISDSNRTSWA